MTKKTTASWLDDFNNKQAVARLNEGIHVIKFTSITPDVTAAEPTIIISFTAEDGVVRTEKLSNITKEGKTYNFLDEFITNLATKLGSQSYADLFANAVDTEITAELVHNGTWDRWRFFKKQPAVAYVPVESTQPVAKPRKRG